MSSLTDDLQYARFATCCNHRKLNHGLEIVIFRHMCVLSQGKVGLIHFNCCCGRCFFFLFCVYVCDSMAPINKFRRRGDFAKTHRRHTMTQVFKFIVWFCSSYLFWAKLSMAQPILCSVCLSL